jgi:hypothetical protein
MAARLLGSGATVGALNSFGAPICEPIAPQAVCAWAIMTIRATAGAPLRAFDGSISGTVVAVVAPRLIVQSWRSDSTPILTFAPQGDEEESILCISTFPSRITRALSTAGRNSIGRRGAGFSPSSEAGVVHSVHNAKAATARPMSRHSGV